MSNGTPLLGEGELKPSKPVNINYREVLSNRHFLNIWISQILGLVGYYITYSVLFLSVAVVTKSSFIVSLMTMMFVLPAVVFGVYGGAFSDEHDKRSVLSGTNILRAIVVLMMVPLVAQSYGLLYLFIAAAVFSIVSQFFIPAETSSLAKLLTREELLKGNSLFSLTLFACTLFGLSLGSFLYDTAGPRRPLIVAAIFFGLATWFVSRLPKMPKERVGQSVRQLFKSVITEFVESLRYVGSVPSLKEAMILTTISQVIIGVILVLAPAFIRGVVGLDPQKAWVMIVPAGVGMLVGALVIGILAQKRNRRKISQLALLLLGLATAAISLTRVWASLFGVTLGPEALRFDQANSVIGSGFILLILGFLFLMGFMISAVVIPAQTTIQEGSEDSQRGRVFGLLNMIINVGAILPLLTAGKLADVLSPTKVLGGVSIFVIVVALVEIRNYRRHTAGSVHLERSRGV